MPVYVRNGAPTTGSASLLGSLWSRTPQRPAPTRPRTSTPAGLIEVSGHHATLTVTGRAPARAASDNLIRVASDSSVFKRRDDESRFRAALETNTGAMREGKFLCQSARLNFPGRNDAGHIIHVQHHAVLQV